MPGTEVVGDMTSALAYFQRRYHALPADERAANLARERAIRAQR